MRKYQILSLVGVFLLIASVPLVAQELAKAVADTPLEPGQTNETVVSAIWAYASAGLLQWWKQSKVGGMSDNMLAWTKRGIALAAAFAGALGVHGSFDAAAGTLTIGGLLWPGIWTAIGDTIRQFAFQQFAYKTAVERREGGV